MKLVNVTNPALQNGNAPLIYLSVEAYFQLFLLLVVILNHFGDEKKCQFPHLDSPFARTAPAKSTKWIVVQR
jgi:hypothetical protein